MLLSSEKKMGYYLYINDSKLPSRNVPNYTVEYTDISTKTIQSFVVSVEVNRSKHLGTYISKLAAMVSTWNDFDDAMCAFSAKYPTNVYRVSSHSLFSEFEVRYYSQGQMQQEVWCPPKYDAARARFLGGEAMQQTPAL